MATTSTMTGPYRVERVETPQGACCRLAGPGLEGGKAYPWEEVREKLQEMAELMDAIQSGRHVGDKAARGGAAFFFWTVIGGWACRRRQSQILRCAVRQIK